MPGSDTPMNDAPDIFDAASSDEEAFSIPDGDTGHGLDDFTIPDESALSKDAAAIDADLDLLRQDTLDLITILDTHPDHSGEDVMAGLLRFIETLSDAQTRIQVEMRAGQNPDSLHDAMVQPLALATRFGAHDLESVTARATLNFADLLDDSNAALTPEASADVLVWMGIAGQTLSALRVMFQLARLYGRAPNGKRLEPTP